jgi:hypothetical protein
MACPIGSTDAYSVRMAPWIGDDGDRCEQTMLIDTLPGTFRVLALGG